MNREPVKLTLISSSQAMGPLDVEFDDLDGLDPLKQLLEEGLIESDEHMPTSADLPSEPSFEMGEELGVETKSQATHSISTLELQIEVQKRLQRLQESALRLNFYQKDIQIFLHID